MIQSISSGIGIIGFLIAIYTFYKTQIQDSKLIVVAGPSIKIYYTPDGGTGFYIPLAFINENAKSGKVISVYIRIKTPSNSIYRLRWVDFAYWDANERKYKHTDHVRPFSVAGQSVVDKFVYFIWRQNNEADLIFEEGKYSITVEVDCSTDRNNKLFKFNNRLVLKEDDISFLQTQRRESKTGIRAITFENSKCENELIHHL